MSQNVEMKLLDTRWGTLWPLPEHATPGAAGVDLRAAIDAPITLSSVAQLVPTGLSIYMADPGMAALIFPRSGLGHKQGVVLGNGTGLIDSDYQGPLMVSLVHRDPSSPAPVIQPGDRIAQMIFVPVLRPSLTVVEAFGADSARGAGGFGHTGSA